MLTIQKLVCQCSGKHPYGLDNIFLAHPIRVEIGYAVFAAPVATGRVLSRLLVGSMLPPFFQHYLVSCLGQRTDLGISTCVISVVRIEFLNLGKDPTYNNIAPAGWSFGELCAGVVTACLPTLRPLLFRVVIPKLSSTTAFLSRKTPLRSRSSSRSAPGGLADDGGAALAENACEMATTGKDEEEGCTTPVTQKQEFRNAM